MKSPSSRFENLIGAGLVLSAILYLIPFVTRGWVSHDEGLIGQLAERALRGGLPHVDFEDPYSGGLSWIYAGLFGLTGVELAHVRWFLFIGAAVATITLHDLCRRVLGPVGAGIATCLGVVWSFPNYFAGLPSWWLLIFGLAALWFVVRHQETGHLGYLAGAGLAAGIAVAIKQTGVYLYVALVIALLFDSAPISRHRSVDRLLRLAVAAGTLLFAVVILRRGLAPAETLYLLLPVSACAVCLALSGTGAAAPPLPRRWIILTLGAAIPVLALLLPYVVSGHIGDLVNGVLVQPQARFAFASLPLPSSQLIILGIPIVALILPLPFWRMSPRPVAIALWAIALGTAILAARSQFAYQLLWQSTRAAAALLPVVICWQLHRLTDHRHRRRLFLAASVLAWMSLNQFPFSAPAYFCYVAPVAVFAAVSLSGSDRAVVPGMLPWAAGLMLFGGLSLNSGYLDSLGWKHQPLVMETPLALPKAHLLNASGTTDIYRTLVAVVAEHLAGGRLVALPDCPEVYFLTGHSNLSGKIYDFLDQSGGNEYGALDREQWRTATVFVINHRPGFSSPLSETALAAVRREFTGTQTTGPFEIRWRNPPPAVR